MSKLVPRIGQSDRFRPLGHAIARQNLYSRLTAECIGVQPQPARKIRIHPDQAGSRDRSGVYP